MDGQILELPHKLWKILDKHQGLKVEARTVRGNIIQLLLCHEKIEMFWEYNYNSLKKKLDPKVYVVELTQTGDFFDQYEVIIDLAKYWIKYEPDRMTGDSLVLSNYAG